MKVLPGKASVWKVTVWPILIRAISCCGTVSDSRKGSIRSMVTSLPLGNSEITRSPTDTSRSATQPSNGARMEQSSTAFRKVMTCAQGGADSPDTTASPARGPTGTAGRPSDSSVSIWSASLRAMAFCLLQAFRPVVVLFGQLHGQFRRLDLGNVVHAELLRLLQPQPHAQLLRGQDRLRPRRTGNRGDRAAPAGRPSSPRCRARRRFSARSPRRCSPRPTSRRPRRLPVSRKVTCRWTASTACLRTLPAAAGLRRRFADRRDGCQVLRLAGRRGAGVGVLPRPRKSPSTRDGRARDRGRHATQQ